VPPAAAAVNSRNTVVLNFAVQVAALLDPLRARALVSELIAVGYPTYLVAPGVEDPDGPYRIRVGRYRTNAEAAAAAVSLGRIRNQKLWVIRYADERAPDPGLNR